MGKRKALSFSSSESEEEKSTSVKKSVNQVLLQAANLSSKNQLLQKGLMKNFDLPGELNSGSTKNKKMVSSSSDSDNDSDGITEIRETLSGRKSKLVNVKERNISIKDGTKTAETSDDSESDSPDSENERRLAQKPGNKSGKNNSSFESESDSGVMKRTELLSKTKSKTNVAKSARKSSSESSSEDEKLRKVTKSKATINTTSKAKSKSKTYKKHSNSGNRSSENEPLQSSPVQQSVRTMETIEKDLKKNSANVSDSDSEATTRNKSNILPHKITPTKLNTPKEQLMDMYPEIKPVSVKVDFDFPKSTDVYLLRIPKNVDPLLLINTEVDLENECRIKIGKKYVIKPSIKIPDPTLVVSDNSKILKFKGNLIMEKYVKSKKDLKITLAEKTAIALPDNLKKRHPLFGSNFEDKIQLSKEVEKKLDDVIAKSMKKKNKSKMKGKEIKQEEEIFQLLNAHNSIAENKIKTEISDDSAFSSCGSVVKRKKSKNTKKNIIDETLTSAKAELFTEYETDMDSRPQKKRKKEKVKEVKEEIEHLPIFEKNIKQEDTMPVLSKKEKRRQSIASSTLMGDISKIPNFNPESSFLVPDILEEKKKKKKSKRKADSDTDIIENDLLAEELTNLSMFEITTFNAFYTMSLTLASVLGLLKDCEMFRQGHE